MCETKKTQLQEKIRLDLLQKHTLKELWKQVKFFKNIKELEYVEASYWYKDFKTLLNENEQEIYHNFVTEAIQYQENHSPSSCEICQICELNDPITQQEVLKAIDTIKAGRASGQDGLVPEIYKCLKLP